MNYVRSYEGAADVIRFSTHFGGDVSEVVGIVARIPLGFGLLCRRIGFGAHTQHLHVDYCRFFQLVPGIQDDGVHRNAPRIR